MRPRSLPRTGRSGRRSLSATAAAVSAVLAAGTLTALGPAAPAAALKTDETYPIAAGGRFVVDGHGFGHGRGMSQYGAYGAARRGLTHRQILDFYYPGTSWSAVTGRVRVLVTADTTRDVVVSPATGLILRDRGTMTTYPLPTVPGLTRWRLDVEDGKTVVDYLTDRWRRWQPGGQPTLAGDGEFQAQEPLTLWTPAGSRSYRGRLRAASPTVGSSERDTVNVTSMDNYVQGVIPAEMPASWPAEAVRSQAVAARTYAAWSRAQAMDRYYQICDTTACQVYGGVSAEDPRGNAAVEATRRQILTYAGQPAFTQFSASNGGWSYAGSAPYLTAKADPYDGHDANPVNSWSVTLDASRIERAYPSIGRLERIRVVGRDGNGAWRGRVWTLVLDGSKADRTISGDTFRWLYGLRSSWFTLRR